MRVQDYRHRFSRPRVTSISLGKVSLNVSIPFWQRSRAIQVLKSIVTLDQHGSDRATASHAVAVAVTVALIVEIVAVAVIEGLIVASVVVAVTEALIFVATCTSHIAVRTPLCLSMVLWMWM